ncbi:hypothetical protein NEF87_004910 [Candidatus Lokiarchaeum ossiferum]|uniref:NYN domain-containing protein n=1 Tax=Candidatus Lokiarchaeum ossiferum TaxID=2951803 RepID=A0ABY6HYK9_9ARCH|nr:hypothetical protein NEF87_004910 [Candidatus Lokiarchaeum sp. B-35]
MSTEKTPPVFTTIFWDYENVSFSGQSLNLFLSGLEVIKNKLGGSFILKCFSQWNNIPDETQVAIISAGFELCQVPQTRKNAVDQTMMVSAVNLSHQLEFSRFILISSDGDFTALCHDLRNKQIGISIISRKHLSNDLREVTQSIYFVTSNGILFEFEETLHDKLIELIDLGVQDANRACANLSPGHKEIGTDKSLENVTIFSRIEWKKAYENFPHCQISPFILRQIFKIDDLYETFLQVYGYGVSKNYDYFCLHESGNNKEIIDLDIFVDLPESMELQIPIQNLPASELNVFKKEISPKKKVHPEIKSLNFTEAIKKAFKTFCAKSKATNINMAVLNQHTCNILGISPSQQAYKKAGFSTFKKALESIKGQLPKKIKIKKNIVSW